METPENVHGPINLGNPVELTVRGLAELIVEKTASQSKIVFQKLPQDDPKQRKPDISKAKKILGWSPDIEISEGLDKTIKYFSSKL
jgi:UDP-glucuronate decarboxylase